MHSHIRAKVGRGVVVEAVVVVMVEAVGGDVDGVVTGGVVDIDVCFKEEQDQSVAAFF